ncbi:MAG: hypothetical protein ACRCT8_13165 [Lacipirellulaceae bacterium]
MTVELPDDLLPLLREGAAAAGFGDRLGDYVGHLVQLELDAQVPPGPPELSIEGKTEEEIAAMLEVAREDIRAGRCVENVTTAEILAEARRRHEAKQATGAAS